MRKFIMPLLAAGFLAVAGTAATPQAAQAGTSVHVGVHGPGWGFHVGHRDRHYRHHRRAHPHWHRERRHYRHHRRHCRPVYRKVWRWTPYGWERFRVKVGRRCYR